MGEIVKRLPLYAALAIILALSWGWARTWIAGMADPYVTVGKPRVKVVEVERVKYLERWNTEIREVKVYLPPQDEPKWDEKDMQEWIIRWEGKIDPLREDVAGIWKVPRAPWGGEFAATLPHDSTDLRGVFRTNPRPFFQVSPVREVGVWWDGEEFSPYAHLDLLRTGPVVWRVGAELKDMEDGRLLFGVAARF